MEKERLKRSTKKDICASKIKQMWRKNQYHDIHPHLPIHTKPLAKKKTNIYMKNEIAEFLYHTVERLDSIPK